VCEKVDTAAAATSILGKQGEINRDFPLAKDIAVKQRKLASTQTT
jgi:hypothetical protein